jgi:hypothetical protein
MSRRKKMMDKTYVVGGVLVILGIFSFAIFNFWGTWKASRGVKK